MSTKERLAKVLDEAGLLDMAQEALRGRYDDFESEHPTPCIDLVRDLLERGRHHLAERAIAGEFDASKAESDAWAKKQTGELGALIDGLGLR